MLQGTRRRMGADAVSTAQNAEMNGTVLTVRSTGGWSSKAE